MSAREGRSASLCAGTVLIGLVGCAALLSLVWTPHDPTLVDATLRLTGPGPEYWLGTDRFGRDIVSQLMVGAQTTLLIGLVSVGAAALLGTPLGVLAALGPRWLDELVMRANDLLLAFPTLLLAIMFGAVFGADTSTAMIAIGIATVPGFARIARAATAQVRSAEFVLAARAAGRGRTGIAVRHVLPNIGGLVIVQGSVSFAIAVLAEAALSYLGFGTRPPTPSWGRMLQESQELLSVEPRLAVAPGIAIAVAVLGFNLLGDGLRDRFDPRLAGRR
ncbi:MULTISPECIES: ABC transporter permease [unclassified Crossiella]|uniref:ABC transporter permease n=1 Tax=unclassified Crossiella TaxID=2620835 RepID=UPI001FFE8857|nr:MULTISPECIES: ABC transporter permease [unclassified Crossiella]MCK2245101.1 ABC transporter permease [Crossiella sp. S99.2]MCK2258682.1 ABC transporter permease [Crossiella sp. S99.1]